jgi:hypothetical protein
MDRAAEGRKTSALAQPRCRIAQPIPALPRQVGSQKIFPIVPRLTRAADPFPPRKGTTNSQPPTTLTLLGLRRGNMSVDTSKSTYNGLARPSRSLTSSLTASPGDRTEPSAGLSSARSA